MLNTYTILPALPRAEELLDSDDTPVDNELQILIPTLLYDMLSEQWQTRTNWFFGINMGIYHTTGSNPKIPIVPDAFLSLGVARRWQEPNGRLSYITWLENDIAPIFVLEIVSHTYGEEYDDKMFDYARLGVLYYVVYNPEYHKRRRRDPLEVYRLVKDHYVRQPGESVWLPKLGLRIGRAIGVYKGVQREWLYWYDDEGIQLPTPTDLTRQALRLAEYELREKERALQQVEQALQQVKLERQQKELVLQQLERERRRTERLAELLRDKGIDLDKN